MTRNETAATAAAGRFTTYASELLCGLLGDLCLFLQEIKKLGGLPEKHHVSPISAHLRDAGLL